VERQANWKAGQLDRYHQAIHRIQDRGISVNGCFVLGLDGAGTENFEQVWEFVKASGLYEVQITVMTAFPGTPLYKRLHSEGRLLQENAWELCTLFDVNFKPDSMSVAELETGIRDLAKRLYSEESTRERREQFIRRLRTVKHARG
jgi:radical SAM superfamily enzyme YgiQ (UPF0313 family)